jgi:hypothetical protein
MPVISVDPISGPETGAGQTITIRLDQPATQAVTVDLQLRGQTAIPQNDVDFNYGASVLQVQTVTIPVGQTSVTTFVFHNGGDGSEVDENYVVELTNPVNATLNGGGDVLQVTGVIEDDGRTLFVSDPTILEGDSGTTEAVFELRISEAASVPMEFSYATLNGSATAGSDYSARSGSVTFAPGQTVVYVRVPVTGDTVSEASETFSLVVSPVGGAANLIFNGVADNVGTGLIRDDDGINRLPVITLETTSGIESGAGQFHIIRLSEASTRDITVTVQIVGGTAHPQNDVDFNYGASVLQVQTVTIPAGDTSFTFPVFHNGGDGSEVDENYVLELTEPVNATLAGGVDVLRETAVIFRFSKFWILPIRSRVVCYSISAAATRCRSTTSVWSHLWPTISRCSDLRIRAAPSCRGCRVGPIQTLAVLRRLQDFILVEHRISLKIGGQPFKTARRIDRCGGDVIQRVAFVHHGHQGTAKDDARGRGGHFRFGFAKRVGHDGKKRSGFDAFADFAKTAQ